MKHAVGLLAASLLLAVTALAPPARADWHTFWAGINRDRLRMNAWPAPFNFVDRDQVRAPMAAMVAKGWQRQNTLGRFYFNPETQQLTEAGERKIRMIVTQHPPEFRTIFVVRANTALETETRLRSVQQLTRELGSEAAVLPTAMEPHGWSAEYINAIDTRMLQTLPDPILPERQAGGDGG